jgi:putative thioredoxin
MSRFQEARATQQQPAPVRSITGQEFDATVIEASRRRPVLVDFWAAWCQPCLMLAPVLEHLAQFNAGRLDVVKVDADRETELAARFGVRALPTVKLFVNGEVRTEFAGLVPLARIQALLEPHLPRASDASVRQADELRDRGHAGVAITELRRALEADPDNHRIHPKLAALLIDQGDLDGAAEILRALPAPLQQDSEPAAQRARLEFARAAVNGPDRDSAQALLDSNPDDLAARYALGAHQALAGEYDAAMGNLLEIVRRDRGFRDDGGRRALLDVFTLLGNDGALVKKYRGLLSSSLN